MLRLALACIDTLILHSKVVYRWRFLALKMSLSPDITLVSMIALGSVKTAGLFLSQSEIV